MFKTRNKVKEEDYKDPLMQNTWINIHTSYTQMKEVMAKTVQ